jgi:4'-phosphopantetheinyl transferase EntD
VIAELLPAKVASAELFADADEASLFSEERAAIANSVAKRRAEFTAGRVCARRAFG